jgi:hypothetical protein
LSFLFSFTGSADKEKSLLDFRVVVSFARYRGLIPYYTVDLRRKHVKVKNDDRKLWPAPLPRVKNTPGGQTDRVRFVDNPHRV